MTSLARPPIVARMLLAQLLDHTRIEVVGEDAQEWLQGQLTCDLNPSQPGDATFGLILSPQGKIVSDTWVLHHPNSEDEQVFSLSLPRQHAETALKRLERYLVMEDVELEISALRLVSAQGPGAYDTLSALTESHVWCVSRFGKIDDPRNGAEVWLQPDDAQTVLRSLPAASEEAWRHARIEAGWPTMDNEIDDSCLPQELGLFSALSFEKGCYLGQEPVVMLEHRGKPPRRLAWVRGQVREGAEVMAGRRVAGVIRSCASGVGLALIKRRWLEDDLTVDGMSVSVSVIEHRA